jgi:hypothetical protein
VTKQIINPEAYEYVDCPACVNGGTDTTMCSFCRGDGVVIRKLETRIKQNPEKLRQAIKRIERMFNEPIR